MTTPQTDTTLHYRAVNVATVKAPTDAEGIVEAIVSVFGNVDSYNERVLPGAFQRSLARKLPKGVWMHDWAQPIAKTLEARELLPGDPLLPDALKDLGGLYIKGQFNLATQRGRDAYSDIAFGLIDEFSIGYFVPDGGAQINNDDGVLELHMLDLKEWSPVLVGANDATAVLSVKSPHAGETLETHSERVLAAVQEWHTRITEVRDLRAKAGRAISAERRERLATHVGALYSVADDLKALVEETTPAPMDVLDGKSDEPEATTADAPVYVDPEIANGLYARFITTTPLQYHAHTERA